MSRSLRLLPVVGLLSSVFLSAAMADDWPQWLGPRRDAVWREDGVLKKFPEGGPQVLWRVPVAAGYAGPAVSDGRVFLMDRTVADPDSVPGDPFARGQIPGQERVLCFDEKTGERLWSYEYDCTYTISYPLGPRVTPTVHGDVLYTLGAEGHLACLNVDTGEPVWSVELKQRYGVDAPVWGFASHPLVDGDRVVCLVGGPGSVAVAFDRHTGREVWKNLSAREPGYAPPVAYEFDGHRQLIIWHAQAVNGLEPETGKLLWSVPIEAAFGMSIGLPRKVEDQLFVSSYQDGAMLLNVRESKADVVWRASGKTAFYTTMSTPFVENGYAYAPDADGEFRCIRLEDGERIWGTFAPTTNSRRAKWATAFIIKNGDRFFLPNELGDLIIARLSPAGYEEIDRAHVLDPTASAGNRPVLWCHPAFANRTMYWKNDKELIAVSLAE